MQAFAAARRADWSRARFSAEKSGNAVAKLIVEWRYLLDENSGASFDSIDSFQRQHPNWPRNRALIARAERAMSENTDPRQVIAWYGDRAPVSGTGMIRLGEALIGTGMRAEGADLIRKAWIQSSFTLSDEKFVLETHGALLSDTDQRARLERLLASNDTSDARRQLSRVDGQTQRLAEARMRLRTSPSAAGTVVARLPETLRARPEILAEQARSLRLRGQDEDAWSTLLRAPPGMNGLPTPGRWWRERHIMTRDALRAGESDVAYNLVARHANDSGASFADAEFLAGWISLRFQNRPEAAAGHFRRLAQGVNLPISKARAYYWLGRAEEAARRTADALAHYRRAAEHMETFYGQLALARIEDDPRLILRSSSPETPREVRAAFEVDEQVQAIRLLAEFDSKAAVRLFAGNMARGRTDAQTLQLLSELMLLVGDPAMSVRIAKLASYNGVLLTDYLDPLIPLPDLPGTNAPPESALVLGVTRQESEFDETAVSSAGARGLMQLMPATARQAANRLRLPYRARDLVAKPQYNMQLGMATLRANLAAWDGSYVLAIAAYNAGTGNVRRWVEAYGDPRDPAIDPIDWIELIPFGETRNYVQRVLENTGVYRNLLGDGDQRLAIVYDLYRPNAPRTSSMTSESPVPAEAARPAVNPP